MRISDRALAIAGVLIGVAGLLFGGYSYTQSIHERVPTFLVDPARAAIVSYDTNNISDLSVLYKGKTVNNSNVTAVRIYFWNSGKEPIQKKDILKNIFISLPADNQILDARILSESRDIAELKINPDENNKNEFLVTFNILEKNDGGSIQIIYAGNSESPISFDGAIIGASLKIDTAYSLTKDTPFLTRLRLRPWTPILLAISMFLLIVWTFISKIVANEIASVNKYVTTAVLVFLILLPGVGLCIARLSTNRPAHCTFGSMRAESS